EFHAREMAAAAFKRDQALDWLPEYHPVSVVPPSRGALTNLERVTRVSQACITNDVPVGRKTKVVCTLGPGCWSEEGLAGLLDAGMDVARFNFSHGTHATHQEVLDRLRKVAAAKKSHVAFLLDTKGPEIRTAMLRGGKDITLEAGQEVTVVAAGEDYVAAAKKSHVAFLLDTKGPEIRTAMLRGGKDITLEAGQEVTVVAAGEDYVKWEGFKDEATGETKIGLSYARLCVSMQPGGIILIADGAISIEVVRILNDTELLGRRSDSYKLCQRKNCNLPGVQVDLPVLGPQDIEDVQNFAVKNNMDFIAASFVQCAEDVRLIRRVLDEAGGFHVKIISKIENEAGLRNIDEILEATDCVMVARGDLAMEVGLGNVGGAPRRVVITATQMLESMTVSKLPTRAEMTDVANAVFDGTDAVMLSGETANGANPQLTVQTMANIVENAELAVDYAFHHDWVMRHNSGKAPVSPLEATRACVAKSAITFSMDANGDGVLDASEGCIAVVFTRSGLAAQLISKYRPPCPVITLSDHDWVLRQASLTYGLYPLHSGEVVGVSGTRSAIEAAIAYGRQRGVAYDGKNILVVTGGGKPWADNVAEISVDQLGSEDGGGTGRSLQITPQLIIDRVFNFRSAKIIASLGPSCYEPDMLETMLDKGVSVFRVFINEAPLGPMVRTAMLRGHTPLQLCVGQKVVLVPTPDRLFEGYTEKEAAAGDGEGAVVHYVGIACLSLAAKLQVGDVLLLNEGAISISVKEVQTGMVDTGLAGAMGAPAFLNGRVLAEVTSPGKLLEDRAVDVAGGSLLQIVSHIDSMAAIKGYDEILEASDAVLISRAHLGMRIPAAKVALAQKWMIAKANLKGRPVIVSAQMLTSMAESPRPTRAEITDVANALYDGADAILLREETAHGDFVEKVVSIAAAILKDAEVGIDTYAKLNYLRNYTPKPMTTLESMCSSAVKAAVDMKAALICVVTNTGAPIRAVAKYRAGQAVVVVTTSKRVAQQCNINFGCVPLLLQKHRKYTMEHIVEMPSSSLPENASEGPSVPNLERPSILGTDISSRGGPPVAPKTLSLRTTAISLEDVLGQRPGAVGGRKTKVVCTLGPGCWSEEGLAALLDAGMDVARFNFSHGTHATHQEVLDRLHKASGWFLPGALVLKARGTSRRTAFLLDTKGPEVRTAMLRGGKDISLEAGQEVTVVAVGDDYDTYEGFKDEATGETKIGLSYAKLCQSVVPGSRILIADGTLSIEVLEITSPTELRGSFIRRTLDEVGGQGVRIICKIESTAGLVNYDAILAATDGIMVARGDLAMEIPSEKVALAQKMMITKANIAGKFVVTATQMLESMTSAPLPTRAEMTDVANAVFDGTDAVMLSGETANGAFPELALSTMAAIAANAEVGTNYPQVALAQKWMITKANIAGKFVITATQMLESMTSAPLPTRAEMTDVANAVFDGTDAVMLSGETANGKFPEAAVRTMAAIVANAENGNAYVSTSAFIRDHTPKPFGITEASGVSGVAASVDCNAQLLITITSGGYTSRMVSKYRPAVPQIVVTDSVWVANQAAVQFGQYAVLVESLEGAGATGAASLVDELIAKAATFAKENGLWNGVGTAIVLHSHDQLSAGGVPALRAVDLAEHLEGVTSFTLSKKPSEIRSFSLAV
ncbi:Pyruvate kinase, partial [Tetrabaena socialis]